MRSGRRFSATVPTLLVPAFAFTPTFTPGARLLSGGFIDVHRHLPNLFGLQHVLPRRHGRVPGRGLIRKPRAAFGDTPKNVRFLQLRNGAGIGKVGWRGIEALGKVPFAAKFIAMTVKAILEVNSLAFG